MTWRLIAGSALLAAAVASAAPVQFASRVARVALLELFTSEGCSSCPPAEKWLAAQRDSPALWRDFVPVAWDVTYWNHLGWTDRFAQPAFTDRQYAYAAAWRAGSVYTPCFVRNGVEWRPGRFEGGDGPPAGSLRVRYDPSSGALGVEFRPADPAGVSELEVHAVQLGGGMISRVTAGENAGRNLAHEFVALAAVRGEMGADGDIWRARMSFRWSAVAGAPRRALAVWVTRRGGLVSLQAVGGWLPASAHP